MLYHSGSACFLYGHCPVVLTTCISAVKILQDRANGTADFNRDEGCTAGVSRGV